MVPKLQVEPEIQGKFFALGVVAAEDTTPAGLATLMRAFADKTGKLLDSAGIQPE